MVRRELQKVQGSSTDDQRTSEVTSLVRVRQIDAKEPTNAALLQWLQLLCLPADVPAKTDEGYWWIAYEGQNPIGFAGMRQSAWWGDTGYLNRAGVIPAARGKGLQKRLIRARELKAKALGLRWLVTDTLNNPASANSLIGCGFKMFVPSKPWGIEGTCYWKKDLKT